MELVKKWVAEPVESIFIQVPRAFVASVLAAVLNLAIVVGLVELVGVHPLPASVIGYLAGGVLQYVLCSVWVFSNAPRSHAVGFVTFTLLSLVGMGITVGVMAVYGRLHMPYQLANVAAMGLTFVWNFSSRKLLLFKACEPAE